MENNALKKLLKKFDMSENSFKKLPLRTILTNTPNMVLAKVIEDGEFIIKNKKLSIKKGSTLVMPFTFYLNSHRDSKRHKNLKPYKVKFGDVFRRYQGQDLTNKTLLVWRTGGFGDLMFTQPVLRYLKEKYPSCKITFATAPNFLPLLSDWPEGIVDNHLTIPFSYEFLTHSDYHLTFEGLIERANEAKNINAYDLYSIGAGVYNEMLKIPDRYETFLTTDSQTENEIKNKLPEDYLVIQMRASSPLRLLDPYKWFDIINKITSKLKRKVVLLDSPDFKKYYNNFIQTYGLDPTMVINMSDLCKTINYANVIIKNSSGVIGIDSAYLHIGNAYKKPVFGIYGPFPGDLRMRYYKKGDWIEPTPKVCSKQPCCYHQDEIHKCPYVAKKQFVGCMGSLDNDKIVERIERLFGEQITSK